jgi:hypothetical protein
VATGRNGGLNGLRAVVMSSLVHAIRSAHQTHPSGRSDDCRAKITVKKYWIDTRPYPDALASVPASEGREPPSPELVPLLDVLPLLELYEGPTLLLGSQICVRLAHATPS